jgi:uncharacterized membrane protein YgaE (UPF0421/DUF939 family)
MARILLNIDDLNHFKFKEAVGEGNMSEMLRNFIYNYNKTNTTQQINKDIEELEKDINQKSLKLITLITHRDSLRKQEEKIRKKQEQEREELFSFDPFAHLETGRGKINEIERILYRVEIGKFIPDWATQRNPENPRGFALELLNNLLTKEKGDK